MNDLRLQYVNRFLSHGQWTPESCCGDQDARLQLEAREPLVVRCFGDEWKNHQQHTESFFHHLKGRFQDFAQKFPPKRKHPLERCGWLKRRRNWHLSGRSWPRPRKRQVKIRSWAIRYKSNWHLPLGISDFGWGYKFSVNGSWCKKGMCFGATHEIWFGTLFLFESHYPWTSTLVDWWTLKNRASDAGSNVCSFGEHLSKKDHPIILFLQSCEKSIKQFLHIGIVDLNLNNKAITTLFFFLDGGSDPGPRRC